MAAGVHHLVDAEVLADSSLLVLALVDNLVLEVDIDLDLVGSQQEADRHQVGSWDTDQVDSLTEEDTQLADIHYLVEAAAALEHIRSCS